MKILYLDFLYPKGHIRQNIEYINCLSEFAKVIVVCPEGYYEKKNTKIEFIEKKTLNFKNGKILSRLNSLHIMFQSALIKRQVDPDYIFISSYDTLTFAIGRFFFDKNDNIFILHHNNIDELNNRVKRFFFKSIIKKVEHIVFEDFICDYLIKNFNIDKKYVHILPHQLNINLYNCKDNKKYKCIGISNSNDDTIISEIINIEKKQSILKEMKVSVILKSNSLNFNNGFLKVINGYLSDDMYNDYINNCEIIYMPFPKSFNYRMSGTLVDAFSNNKIIISTDIPLIQYYSIKYPEICKIAYNINDFFKYLKIKSPENKCFIDFKEEHSHDNIIIALKKIFQGENKIAK